MEYLFTYGTLRDPQVQRYVFGRILEGHPDILPQFRHFKNVVYKRYDLVRPSEKKTDFVEGMAYALTKEELLSCDVYETSAYIRKVVVLKSGIKAWVYINNPRNGRSNQ
ncbi:MAG: gamma-glutamylcyclotransferase family protein [Bacteroidota bacterium]